MLKLYGFAVSNYYNMVKLALLEKDLPFEEVAFFAGKTPEALVVSPCGKVPVLGVEQGYINETSVILDYIEQTCNAPIVFEEVNFVDWATLDPDDPYRTLAKKLLTTGFLDPKLRVDYIAENVGLGSFNGCILYNHGFGRCSLADSCLTKHLREELTKVNLPVLLLDGDCVDPTIAPCSTLSKISAFVEALNEKKFGNIFGPLEGSKSKK